MIKVKTIWVIQVEFLQLNRSICQGIHRYAQVNKMPWRVRRYDSGWENARNYSILNWENADGAVLGITSKKAVSKALQNVKIPVVNTFGDYRLAPFPQVDINNYKAGKMAAEYFLRKGFRSFLCAETPYSRERQRGFLDSLRALGFNVPVFSMSSSIRETNRSSTCEQLIDLLRPMRKPVALYCEHDLLAVDVISALQEHGLHVPNDVAVLGTQDDDLVCKSISPSISSINLPYEEVGYEAARIMDILLRGAPPPANPIQLDPLSVTERQSTHLMAVPDLHIQKAITYIQKNACGSITVTNVARASGLSLRLLQNHFRSALGYTLQEEIRRVRIARAKKLLETTDLTLIEVAEAIGYTDKSHLIATFRSSTGMTPGNYRKQFNTQTGSEPWKKYFL